MRNKVIFGLGGILLITALIANISIHLNKAKTSETSILTFQNKALADSETNDGFIAINTDCIYSWWAQDPFTGEWHYYESPGHITNCWIDFLNFGCDEHGCIWDI